MKDAQFLLVNLESLEACAVVSCGETTLVYTVTQAGYSIDQWEYGCHVFASGWRAYDRVRMDADGVPDLVKWIIRGLHGLPQTWKGQI